MVLSATVSGFDYSVYNSHCTRREPNVDHVDYSSEEQGQEKKNEDSEGIRAYDGRL